MSSARKPPRRWHFCFTKSLYGGFFTALRAMRFYKHIKHSITLLSTRLPPLLFVFYLKNKLSWESYVTHISMFFDFMCPPSGTHKKFFSATHAWYCATYRFYPARSTIFVALICAFRLRITHTSLRLFTHALTCALHEMRNFFKAILHEMQKFSTNQKIFFANAPLTWNVDTNWQIETGEINKKWQIGLAAKCTRAYTTLTSILNPSPSSSPLPSNSGSK